MIGAQRRQNIWWIYMLFFLTNMFNAVHQSGGKAVACGFVAGMMFVRLVDSLFGDKMLSKEYPYGKGKK